jgi:hypothetical protein
VADCAHDPRCPDFPAHRARQLADWKAARAAHAKALRNGRTRRKPRQYRPGMNIIRKERP